MLTLLGRFIGTAQYPGGAHRDEMCMYTLIVTSVRGRVCMNIYICTEFFFKKKAITRAGKIISLSIPVPTTNGSIFT
jgi:hypothetical protein